MTRFAGIRAGFPFSSSSNSPFPRCDETDVETYPLSDVETDALSEVKCVGAEVECMGTDAACPELAEGGASATLEECSCRACAELAEGAASAIVEERPFRAASS